MASSSSPASAASLIQRLSAKEWNVRQSANEELIALLNDASEGSVADFAKYVPYLKKIVVDPYPPVKEKAMDALLIFMSKFNFNSVVPANFGGDLAAILIDKCLSARDSIKTKAVEALLLLIENGSVDVVISELCRVATTHKVHKISALCVLTLREAVMQFGFGPTCIPGDNILPILEPCFDHPFKDMRTEAFALAVEIYRWMGPALKPHVKGLRPTQLKELEAAFEMIPPDANRQTPVKSIKKSSTPATSAPVSVPSTGLQQSPSNSAINSSPSTQASLANLKNNPKRRSLSIPKAIQLQSPSSATPPSNITSPYTPNNYNPNPSPSAWSPAHVSSTPPHQGSQIPIRRSLTSIHTNASASSTPTQSPVSTPTSANSTISNRTSISLSHDESLLDGEEFQVREADLSGDVDETEQQNLPPIDLLSNLSSEWYKTLLDTSAANTWHTRKAQVDQLIALVPSGSPLKGHTTDYTKLVTSLTRLLSDPNISVQQSVLRAIEILAVGLKADFAPHAKRLAPFLLEKFKEKKPQLVEIVHTLLDTFHQVQCLSVGDVIEPIITTLSSKNPQMKYECLSWLERVIPTTSRQVLTQVSAPLCDSFVKCLDDSVVAVRNTASRAFAWLIETLGEQAVKATVDGLSRQHQSKLKEVREMLAINKKEPAKPANPSSKPVPTPRPGPVRTSSKSLLPIPRPSPIRQSSDYFDDGEADKSNDEEQSESEHRDEDDKIQSGSMESPFNESNSVYQVLHTMRAEISNFTSKMNSSLEVFEKRLKEKEGRRKEENQNIQEYDKELHSWNEDLKNKNKAIMEELQQEKALRQELETRLAQAEELNTSHASNAANADAEAQEKLALFDELETVTMEKDDAISRLEMMTLEKEEAVTKLEAEQARYSEDASYLSSLEDEELDRMEVEFQRYLQALAKAREIKEESADAEAM